MNDTVTIMNKGINCLLEKLGALETEIFITNLLREPFDSLRGLHTPPLCGDNGGCNPRPIPYENNIPRCSAARYVDYTKWRRDNLYADVPLHELNQQAAQFAKDHPLKSGKFAPQS